MFFYLIAGTNPSHPVRFGSGAIARNFPERTSKGSLNNATAQGAHAYPHGGRRLFNQPAWGPSALHPSQKSSLTMSLPPGEWCTVACPSPVQLMMECLMPIWRAALNAPPPSRPAHGGHDAADTGLRGLGCAASVPQLNVPAWVVCMSWCNLTLCSGWNVANAGLVKHSLDLRGVRTIHTHGTSYDDGSAGRLTLPVRAPWDPHQHASLGVLV